MTELIDAERRHGGSPVTFEIPPKSERESLDVGDYAKLIFEGRRFNVPNERMWVEVTEVELGGSGRYSGKLRNLPRARAFPARGEQVVFHARHIIEIRKAPA